MGISTIPFCSNQVNMYRSGTSCVLAAFKQDSKTDYSDHGHGRE